MRAKNIVVLLMFFLGFMPARAAFLGLSDCVLPPVSPFTKVALLAAYETRSLSSVALGQQDNVIRAGIITIEPGANPIAVVVTTYDPVIWQFRGATSRIEWAVLTSEQTGPNGGTPENGPPLMGATGLAAERVRTLPLSWCLRHFSDVSSANGIEGIAFVKRQLGRAPDIVSASYSVTGFELPSGNPIMRENGPGTITHGPLTREIAMYFPGGIIEMDPGSVIASHKAEPYIVLPVNAGIQQLIMQGALIEVRSDTYRITRKIRFPAGLYGGHRATFLIPQGVPIPDGAPGHSCVLSEKTGKALFGVCP